MMKTGTKKVLYFILSVALILISLVLKKYIGQLWSDVLINLILIMSAIVMDTIPCIFVALTAPFIAKLFAVTNLPIAILAVVSLSNIIFITVYTVLFQVFASRSIYQKIFTWGIAILASAFAKYLILYYSVNNFLLNILEINTEVTYRFDFIQFKSALIAGIIAFLIVKPVKMITKVK